jgi:hypothetical protein
VIRRTVTSVIAVLALLASVLATAPAQAQVGFTTTDVEPPWCGTPENDAAGNLPDGTQPGQPVGSFPHIPYFAIRCTLEDIVASSNGRMTLEVMGKSALGRDLFLVTVNALDTVQQRKDWQAWQQVRKVALTDPARGQQLLASYGDDVKVPLYIQGAIHGNEYEGVEAIFETLHRLATTPYGTDPEVDAVLDHSILLFNVIQNPDGRVAGTRADRGDHQAAQPEHRLRPVAQVEPASHRRQRGGHERRGLRRHPADQRLVCRHERPGPGHRSLRRWRPRGPRSRRGLG